MAVIAMLAAAASSADGATGGVNADGEDPSASCERTKLGKRTLSLGDCGKDVKTLNWILNSKKLTRTAPMSKRFKKRTDKAVARFQRKKAVGDGDGVVDRSTTKALVRSMRKDLTTWYGTGMWGNGTACGKTLRRSTIGVAHKTLPCGTKVTFRYRGRFLRTRVIDRGPYAHGAKWDLTKRAAKKLGFLDAGAGVDKVRTAIVR